MIVATVNNRPVAFLMLLLAKKLSVIDLIAVSKEHRKKGVSKQMIAYALQNLSDRNRWIVGTQSTNVPSVKLYQSMGFQIINSQYVLHKHFSLKNLNLLKIGNFDTDKKVLIIAEIGNNHEGDFELAKEMIDAAAEAGADAVKFQTITPNRLVSITEQERIRQLQRFSFDRDQFATLKERADEKKVYFLSTPFDLEAVDWLNPLVPAFKIASGDNDFWPLLEKIASTGKPVILSLGLGKVKEATQIASFLRKHGVDQKSLFQDLHYYIAWLATLPLSIKQIFRI